jgi:hypothetical protein
VAITTQPSVALSAASIQRLMVWASHPLPITPDLLVPKSPP